MEDLAEVIGRQARCIGQVRQGKGRAVFFIDKAEGIFQFLQLGKAAFYRLYGDGRILLFLDNKAKHRIEKAYDDEFIAGLVLLKLVKESRNDSRQLLIVRREMVADAQGMGKNLVQIRRMVVRRQKEFLRIKDEAFVYGVIRVDDAAMNDAVTDEDNIAGYHMDCLIVEGNGKAAVEDMDEFIFHVPMIGHVEARMIFLYMIEANRKVKAAALHNFVIAFVFHKDAFLLSS